MKRNTYLFLLVLMGIPAPLFSNTLYFPQVAFGGEYSTTFIITNTGTTPVASTINFYDQSGNTRPELSKAINLAAGNSVRFTMPIVGPTTTIVWGELAADAGTVKGVASFDRRAPNGVLLASAGVLGMEGGNSFLLPVDIAANSVVSTGVAIANVSGIPVTVRLRLIREDGTELSASSSAVFNPLGARRQTADFVPAWFPQLVGAAFRGTLIVDAPGAAPNSLSATALTVKEDLLAALPVIPSGNAGTAGSTLYFPHVAYGGEYSTHFVIMNTGQSAISSSVNFYDQFGILRTELSQPVNLPPGGSSRFAFPGSGGTTRIVWGELSPGAGTVQGVATFDRRGSSGVLRATAGVLGLAAKNSYNFPVDIAADHSFGSTGVAIANATNSPVNVTLRLLGESGVQVGSSTNATFNPLDARRQIADFVPLWFPQIVGTAFKGTLVVEAGAGTPQNALSATALTVKEGFLSTLPVNAGSIAGSTGGGGMGGPGPASACLNVGLYTSTHNVHLEYRAGGSQIGTQVSDVVYRPNVSFEANNASEWSQTLTNTYVGSPVTIIGSKTYYALDGADTLDFGSMGEITTPFSGTFKTVHNPARRDGRWSLPIGESWTYTFTKTTTLTITGLPPGIPQPPPEMTTETYTVKYLGRETVSVPAGTFDTCKFEEDGSTTTWRIIGSGVEAKSIGGGLIRELTAGTINDTAISQ